MWTLNLSIQSNWFVGSGREAGAYADLLMLKDEHGMPFLPGRSLRGLLRNAFNQASANNWFGNQSQELVQLLFGQEGTEGLASQGVLQISSATLAAHEYQAIVSKPELKSFLFRRVTSTAIDETTGAALEGSLRSMEVAVPVNLVAEVSLNQAHPDYSQMLALDVDINQALDACAALITHIGGHRYRGFGQCLVSVEEAGDSEPAKRQHAEALQGGTV